MAENCQVYSRQVKGAICFNALKNNLKKLYKFYGVTVELQKNLSIKNVTFLIFLLYSCMDFLILDAV